MTDNVRNWFRRRYVKEYRPAYEALMRFYPFTLEDLGGEEWADVPNYEGLYQVSTFGRVKSFQRGKEMILKPQLDNHGYLYVGLHKKGFAVRFQVSRLVAGCFVPNLDSKSEVNHEDGHPLNNHVSNLVWVTHAENIRHAIFRGLRPSGSADSRAKLSDDDVCYIRDNPEGLTGRQLAKLFNVHVMTISGVQLGKHYKTSGGKIRQAYGVPQNVREEIKRLYVYGSSEYGSTALGRKFNLSSSAILHIVKEK